MKHHNLQLIVFYLLVCFCGLTLFITRGQTEEDDQDDDDTPLCGEIYTSHVGARSKDPIAEMGGLQNIDKIIKIDVDTAHNLFFCNDNRVIGRMGVT